MANFEHYKVFYYVAMYKNITHAAERLCLTQPSVTKSIQVLEAQLGCKLFVRSKKGVRLTPEGDVLFCKVQPACRAIFDVEKELERLKTLDAGRVKISAESIALKPILFSAIMQYREMYPSVTIDIQGRSQNRLTALESGELDMILDLVSMDSPPLDAPSNLDSGDPHKGIEVLMLQTLFDVPVVGKELAALAEQELCLDDILQYPMILRRMDLEPHSFYNQLLRDKIPEISLNLIMDSLTMRLYMTQMNLGICFVPQECIQKEISDGTLFPLKIKETLLERKLALLVPKDRQMSIAAEKFVEMVMQNVFPGNML